MTRLISSRFPIGSRRLLRDYYRTLLAVGVASFGFALCSANAGAQTCSAKLIESKPITLDDGSTVTVDAGRLARNGSSMMILGTETSVFPRPQVALITGGDSAIGVLRDGRGRYRLVPAPPVGAQVLHPRAASAGPAGWHVIFVTGQVGIETNPATFSRARLWYGRYDGTKWMEIGRIAEFTNAQLAPQLSSPLVAAGDSLYFAFAVARVFSPVQTEGGIHGVLMVRRTLGRWKVDTLQTWDTPAYVTLALNGDRIGVTAAIAQSYFERQRPWRSALFLTRFDSAWHSPRRVFADSTRSVMAPSLEIIEGQFVLSWSVDVRDDADEFETMWGQTRDHGATFEPFSFARTFGFPEAGEAAFAENRVAWFVRDGRVRNRLRVWLRTAIGFKNLGTIAVPVDNLVTLAAPLNDRQMLVLSGSIGSTDFVSRPASIVSIVSFECGSRSPLQR